MNTIDTIRLSDAELEVVAGGMTCNSALALANVYLACASLTVAGNQTLSNHDADLAKGVVQGGCF